VIVGDIGREAAVALVDRVFGALPASQLASSSKPAALAPSGQPIHIAKAMPLATAAFGLELPDRSSAGIAAVRVLSHIIGSGDFDSVLMEEIRVKRGLAYTVSTSLVLDDVSALLLGGMSTKPENMAAAIATLREVIETLAREGPDAGRFEAAKSYLLGTRPLDLDGNARRASTLSRAWREGARSESLATGGAEIEQVTFADVTHAARQLLDWDRMRIVTIGAVSPVATPR
jgi:zinc protease